MERIVILKRTAFGDIVHTLPVIPALKRAFPRAHITWIVESGLAKLVSAVEGVDAVVEIGFRSLWRSGLFREYRARLRHLRTLRADVLIDFQGTLKSWLMIVAARAGRTIGFNHADAREPSITRFYSEQAPPMPYGLHIVRQNLRVLALLGIEQEEIVFPRLHLDLLDEEFIDNWMAERGISRAVAVNPFTTWFTKNWPPEHAAALCRALPALGLQPLVLWGPGERDAAQEIVARAGDDAFLAPPTTLPRLAALLRRCHIYLGGDTGPTHLAAALGTPLVALFGPTDPRRNGPVDPDDETLWLQMECKGCTRRRCRLNANAAECMARLTPEMALEAVRRRLAKMP
jgi:lipopolysaccharide heptosyltransferase I